MEPFVKILNPGSNCGRVFVKVDWNGKRLSITGVDGPKSNGDARGGCGQIIDTLRELGVYAPGWDKAKAEELARVWERWHLNDMRAGCEHQRAEEWDERPIDPTKPTHSYGKHFPGQQQDSWNMLAWVRQDEHSEGLLMKPCDVCGYKYGSAWLTEEVPAEVLEYLQGLPETEVTPAWV